MKSIGVSCSGRQPWQGWKDRQDCLEIPLAVQRGAATSTSRWCTRRSRSRTPPGRTPTTRRHWRSRTMPGSAPSWPSRTGRPSVRHDRGHPREDLRREWGLHQGAGARRDASEHRAEPRPWRPRPGDLLSEEWAAFLTEMQNGEDPQLPYTPCRPGKGGERRRGATLMTESTRSCSPTGSAKSGRWRASTASRRAGRTRWSRRAAPQYEVAARDRSARRGDLPVARRRQTSVWEEQEAVRHRVAELDKRLERSFMVQRLRERTGPSLEPRYVLLHTLRPPVDPTSGVRIRLCGHQSARAHLRTEQRRVGRRRSRRVS